MQYIVMRAPCLMEDEGRHFAIAAFKSRALAEEWISSQEGEYFRPSDYYVLEAPEEVE